MTASGNYTSDATFTYAWDGESQLKSAGGVNYSYDGEGRRVAKSNGKLYWYGSGGEILAESDASGTTTAEYIFFGGRRIAMLPAGAGAQFFAEDFLGSSRAITTSTGVLCYDADLTPYGGESSYTNTCPQNSYKFEGKERDAETGNDDFGARYYSNRFGRWLSADWSNVPVPIPYANLTNPQTLNLYSMVTDDPESFADLDGHQSTVSNKRPLTDRDCAQEQGDVAACIEHLSHAQTDEIERKAAQDEAHKNDLEKSSVAAGVVTSVEAVAEKTMEQIDKVVKPLIESAAEEAGPAVIGLSKVAGAAAGVVVELLTAPATASNDGYNFAEHKKGARPSTEEKHEEGEARKKKDRGGEKADPKRPLPRRRPPNWKGPYPPPGESTY
jgi:RHS repeat-associated protein